MTVLIDSDVLIEISRGRNSAMVALWMELNRSEDIVLYSPVSVAELWAGARSSEYVAIDNLFRTLARVVTNEEVGRLAGKILGQYRKSHGLGIADALIAACAIANEAKLWTLNRKHYPMKDLSFFAGGALKPGS